MECNDLFDYGLKIYQNKEFFKFSLDSILLGEFVKTKKGDNILDMCTGNSPIPLILISKNKDLQIDAVEIQKPVFDLAKKSIEINEFGDKINVINEDVKLLNTDKKYDIITCNPPYFKVTDSSLVNDNETKKIARHEVSITLEDVIGTAKKHIKENGSFYMVHRVDRLLDTIDILKKESFGIRRICFIFTKENANAEFFLIEASKYKKDDLKVTSRNVQNLKTYKDIFKEG